MGQVKPGEGERRAASGYGGQYRIAAQLIYRGLRSDQLNWVGIADPEAGRVDDLLLGEDGRVDAFQVKWSQFAGNISFNDLIAPPAKARSGDVSTKPCLIAQLAEGWGRLRERYPGQRVVVHLVTNDLPSKHDPPPAGIPSPSPKHFASFLAQAWEPAHASCDKGSESIPSGWRPAWESLKGASALSAEVFDLFARDLELDFGFTVKLPEIDSQLDAIAFDNDHTAIEKFLFDIAGDPEHISTLTREELIVRLGWGDRYRPRSRHEFPGPAFAYEPIRPTKDELESKLNATHGGYLAVLGPPGSGKSTLLTESLRCRGERKIRYYAYVPDSIEPGRGEARNFLHDVVIAIERAGFRAGESIPGIDRTDLSRRLHLQLEKLHQDFVQNGRRTIILVDGLDHIDREQHPERSLLRDLPPPEHVPDGVLFLLGSQTTQLPELSLGSIFNFATQVGASRCNPFRGTRPFVFWIGRPLPTTSIRGYGNDSSS
jgi:hypothetical protein